MTDYKIRKIWAINRIPKAEARSSQTWGGVFEMMDTCPHCGDERFRSCFKFLAVEDGERIYKCPGCGGLFKLKKWQLGEDGFEDYVDWFSWN